MPKPDDVTELKAGALSVLVSRSGADLFLDVFAEGRGEAICTLRLDADERTVTLYEPDPDESRTLYEPEAPSLAACPSCHCEHKPGELRRADGRCFPACLPPLRVRP